MNDEKLAVVLRSQIDDLFLEIALQTLEVEEPTRALPSRAELVRQGRLQFESLLGVIRKEVCREEIVALANATSSEKELILLLMDSIVETAAGLPVPVLTLAGVIAKLGLDRLCRGYSKGD